MKKYEHKILSYTGKGMMGVTFDHQEIEATITGFGLKGWELVAVVNSNSNSNGKAILLHYLQREVKE